MQFTNQVALQTDELHPGLQVLVGVAAENLDELHQVCTELVASLQDAQHHYVVVPEVIHDVVGQTLDPAGGIPSRQIQKKKILKNHFAGVYVHFYLFMITPCGM